MVEPLQVHVPPKSGNPERAERTARAALFAAAEHYALYIERDRQGAYRVGDPIELALDKIRDHYGQAIIDRCAGEASLRAVMEGRVTQMELRATTKRGGGGRFTEAAARKAGGR